MQTWRFTLVFERLNKLMGKYLQPQKLKARHCKVRIKEFPFPTRIKKIMEFCHIFYNKICSRFALVVLIWSFKSVNTRCWGKVNLTFSPRPTEKIRGGLRTQGNGEQELVPSRPKYRSGNCLFMNVVTSSSTYDDVLSCWKAMFGFSSSISGSNTALICAPVDHFFNYFSPPKKKGSYTLSQLGPQDNFNFGRTNGTLCFVLYNDMHFFFVLIIFLRVGICLYNGTHNL